MKIIKIVTIIIVLASIVFIPQVNMTLKKTLYHLTEKDAQKKLDDGLYHFIHKKNKEKVIHHLEYGANPNACNRNLGTPLMAAAFHGDLDVFKILEEYGADINIKCKNNDFNINLVENAIFGDNAELFNYILRKDKTFLKVNKDLLAITACKGNVDIFKKIVENGFPMNCEHYINAIDCGCDNIVNFLLANNVDVECALTDKYDKEKQGFTPLMYLLIRKNILDDNFLIEFLDRGADPNHSSDWGYTPLLLAIERDDSDSLMILLKNGSDITKLPFHLDYKGMTYLEIAEKLGSKECEKVLKSYNK